MFARAVPIANAQTVDLKELADIAGVGHQFFYVDADFNGVDIRGQSLEGMDLRAANFEGVIADSGTRVDLPFRSKVFRATLRTREVNWRDLSPDLQIDHAVVVARAGLPALAESIVDEVLRSRKRLPSDSVALVRCEEISAALRNKYYTRWHREYSDSPYVAVTLALAAHDRSILNAVSDLTAFVDRFISADLEAHAIDQAAITMIALEKAEERTASILAQWFDEHRASSKTYDVYWYMFSFKKWAVPPIAEAFSRYLLANHRNRKIGELVAKGIGYFDKGQAALVVGELMWLEKNMRAKNSKEVLLQLLRTAAYSNLASTFLRWTRLNNWHPNDGDELVEAATGYLSRRSASLPARQRTLMEQRLRPRVAQ